MKALKKRKLPLLILLFELFGSEHCNKSMHACMHSFSKYFLSAHQDPGTVLSHGNTAVNKNKILLQSRGSGDKGWGHSKQIRSGSGECHEKP